MTSYPILVINYYNKKKKKITNNKTKKIYFDYQSNCSDAVLQESQRVSLGELQTDLTYTQLLQ